VGKATRAKASDKAVEQCDPSTVAGIAHLAEFSLAGHAAKATRISELTDVLVRRIRTHHNQPDFDLKSWIDALRRSQEVSAAAHTLAKADAGMKLEKLYTIYRKKLNDNLPKDTEDVMRGHNKAAKEAFQGRQLEETLAHIIDIAYHGEVLGATPRDRQRNELQRIYTHLWWMAEQPEKQKRTKKNRNSGAEH